LQPALRHGGLARGRGGGVRRIRPAMVARRPRENGRQKRGGTFPQERRRQPKSER
jgi:hypothetical protein